MEIVTGSTGQVHVTPIDDAVRNGNQGYLGKNVVFTYLSNFEATSLMNNEIRIYSGYGIMYPYDYNYDYSAPFSSNTIVNVQSFSDSWVGQIAQDYRNGNIFVRGKNNGSWTAWKKVRAEYSDDSAKLGGYSASTSATGNTIAMRQGNGYLYATYFNQSSGAETPTSSSYVIYCNSDGFFRKSSIANMKSLIDTNTWRGIQNNLTSTSTTDSLSANQGRLLANGSARDSTKLPLAGGTCSGKVYSTDTIGTSEVLLGITRVTAGSSGTTISGTSRSGAGRFRIFGGANAAYYTDIVTATLTANRTATLPNTGGTFAWASSSRRIKENIRNMTEEEAQKILNIDVVKFDYKGDWCGGEKNRSGFIAEDVQKIIPETVHIFEDYDPNLPVDEEYNFPPEMDYQRFVPYLVKMVQIQQEQINELKAEIKALKEG